MVHPEMQVAQAVMVNPDHKARPAHLAHLALLAKMVLLARRAKTEN
jgi:hypothetical protein